MGPCEVSKRAKFLKGMFKRHRSGLSERRKDEEPAKWLNIEQYPSSSSRKVPAFSKISSRVSVAGTDSTESNKRVFLNTLEDEPL